MAKLLHIQASPMGDLSFSNRLASAFLDSYGAAHPSDSIEQLDLWKKDLPPFDFTAASGKYKVLRGLDHSPEEARAWQRVVELTEHLKSADKVVLSSGMWNFSVPYRLKQFIDNIVQPGLSFSYDPVKGYSGLITGKPLQILLASGSEYPAGSDAAAMDFQKPYLEMIFQFIGFQDIRTLRVEGTLSARAGSNLEKGMEAAVEAGKNF